MGMAATPFSVIPDKQARKLDSSLQRAAEGISSRYYAAAMIAQDLRGTLDKLKKEIDELGSIMQKAIDVHRSPNTKLDDADRKELAAMLKNWSKALASLDRTRGGL